MAKPSSVTYEAVAKACLELFAAGKNPSFPAVYAAIGNVGSAKIVQDFIVRWRQDIAAAGGVGQPPAVPGVPEEAVAVWLDLLPKLWPTVFETSEAIFTARRLELEKRIQIERETMTQTLQAAEAEVAAARGLVAGLETELSLASEKHRNLQERISELSDRLESERDARQDAESELEKARADFARKEEKFTDQQAEMQTRLDSERRDHIAALLSERRQHDESTERLRTNHQQELSTRDARIVGLEQDASRSAVTEATLRTEKAALEGAIGKQQADIERQGTVIAALQKRLEGAEEQIQILGQEKVAAEARAKALDEFRRAESSRADEIAEQLENAGQTIIQLQGTIQEMKASPPPSALQQNR